MCVLAIGWPNDLVIMHSMFYNIIRFLSRQFSRIPGSWSTRPTIDWLGLGSQTKLLDAADLLISCFMIKFKPVIGFFPPFFHILLCTHLDFVWQICVELNEFHEDGISLVGLNVDRYPLKLQSFFAIQNKENAVMDVKSYQSLNCLRSNCNSILKVRFEQ